MEKDKHLGLRIDSETHKKLKSLAEFEGRSTVRPLHTMKKNTVN